MSLRIETKEYGPLQGDIMTMEELDSIAKARYDTVRFLGVFTVDGHRYGAFILQNRHVFVLL